MLNSRGTLAVLVAFLLAGFGAALVASSRRALPPSVAGLPRALLGLGRALAGPGNLGRGGGLRRVLRALCGGGGFVVVVLSVLFFIVVVPFCAAWRMTIHHSGRAEPQAEFRIAAQI